MAHAMTYDLGASGVGGPAGWLARSRKALADWRLYRRTLDELASLTDRELADLGISRHSLRDIAYESVYGG